MAKESAALRRLRDRAVAYAQEDQRTDLLVSSLSRWMESENQTPEALAQFLGTDATGLSRLSLCRPPRQGAYVEDIEAIAGYSGCRVEPLRHLLRRLEVLTALTGSAPTAGQQRASLTNAILLAARDREIETGV
jgi:hypothetical protein